MPAHWVIFSYFAWGHLRPVSNLAVTLARKFPDVTISCIVDADFVSQSLGEMKRNVSLGHDEWALDRIRLIPLGRTLAAFTPEFAALYPTLDPRLAPITPPADVQTLHAAFHAMMEERPFEDATGKTWEPITKPNFIISDMMLGNVCPALKKKYDLPLYIWYGGSATSLTRALGATEKGGRAPSYVEECHAIEGSPEKRMGRSFSDIAIDVWARSSSFQDDIIHVKGLPPFYQWEDFPQKTWYPAAYDWVAAGHPMFELSDGILLPTVADIELEGLAGVMDWYGGTVLCVGPQLPAEYFNHYSAESSSQLASTEVQYDLPGVNKMASGKAQVDPCIAFLDDALDRYGAHSVIYISFGSVFFPNERHIQILFERMLGIDDPMAFIFTTAAPNAFLSEEFTKKIEESKRGLIVPWAPQQAILAHLAIGAIISHCGGGGTFESLSHGVPVIGWPFFADQPTHALWMSEVLDTGFELVQVRDGPFKGKAYRGGINGTEITGRDEAVAKEMEEVLSALRGEEGKRKRVNAQKVKQLIRDAHRPGGQIQQHLDALDRYVNATNEPAS
ncbi:glycosyltransferase family 1 protein [Calocera viscosa TUFC12733]|uniref:Glycosyltransferase family 1 protein n=1 Tax=Calocera viscosa (strain TUFC12733) TaxID=1330018 RepID=A0A167PPK4_CALVF|nr:glycosyltransferase family 1 protein [Calocera viscosa TUFC12733]